MVKRQLSGASVESIKQAISDNRFFELQGFYPPKDGVTDYFSHSLTVTMDGRAHSVSSVNEWTLAEPVPKGLGMIVGTIQQEYDNASEPSMDNGKRRITETMVKQSASHNAEGHASPGCVSAFGQAGYVYNGAPSRSRPTGPLTFLYITMLQIKPTTARMALHTVL